MHPDTQCNAALPYFPTAVALTNVSGLEGPTLRMLQMAEAGRAQWAARVRARSAAVLPHA